MSDPAARAGYTGSRTGMTDLQKLSLSKLLTDLRVQELHHGDCIGGDAQAHEIALSLHLRIVVHPPAEKRYRAFCQGAHEVREPKAYLTRNRDIVGETRYLIGASVADRPLSYGGTWYTINYARQFRDAYVIWPSGAVSLMLRRV